MERIRIDHWIKEIPFKDLTFEVSKKSFYQQEDTWTQGPLFFSSNEDAKQWILEKLSYCGKTWDAKYPFLDFEFQDQFRIHVVFPPISNRNIQISIRSHFQNHIKNHWKTDANFKFLSNQLNSGKNILVCGATGSGKTTFLRELIQQIPVNRRVICLEDTAELSPRHPHCICLKTRKTNADGFGNVDFKELIFESLRMRPDHLVLGECRGAEVLVLLQAMNTGHRGTLGSIHANHCRDALKRIELLCHLYSKNNIHASNIRSLIASSLNFIVHLEQSNRSHQIQEIHKIEGLEGDTLLSRPLLKS